MYPMYYVLPQIDEKSCCDCDKKTKEKINSLQQQINTMKKNIQIINIIYSNNKDELTMIIDKGGLYK